ncbi:MAG TPA: S8 family serine peptidase, partial [Brevibacterium sp.]|nr:S8 family serine peptidase [Brevibacterium sp.]
MPRRGGDQATTGERRRRRERRRRVRTRVLQLLAILAALGLVAATIFGGSAGAAEAQTDAPEPGPGQWFMDDYDIPELWETGRGDGVTVAVIDSGVSDEHENLTDRVTAARDFSGAGKDGTEPVGAESIIHHGTAVAGVVAGTGAGSGPVGVAPEARIASASVWLGGGAPEAAQSTRVQAEQA